MIVQRIQRHLFQRINKIEQLSIVGYWYWNKDKHFLFEEVRVRVESETIIVKWGLTLAQYSHIPPSFNETNIVFAQERDNPQIIRNLHPYLVVQRDI